MCRWAAMFAACRAVLREVGDQALAGAVVGGLTADAFAECGDLGGRFAASVTA